MLKEQKSIKFQNNSHGNFDSLDRWYVEVELETISVTMVEKHMSCQVQPFQEQMSQVLPLLEKNSLLST